MSASAAVGYLQRQIDRNLAIADRIPESGRLRESLDRLQSWQRSRIEATYADLAATERSTVVGMYMPVIVS